MLTYPVTVEVFRFMEFEKRKSIAQKVPRLRNLHKILPLRLETCKIFGSGSHVNILLDAYSTWIFETFGYPRKTIIHHRKHALDREDDDKKSKSMCHVEFSKNEGFQRFCRFYFDRKGGCTKIRRFIVTGCPPKLPPFSVRASELEAHSDRDIEKWFHIFPRDNFFRKVSIFGNSIYQLLLKDTILQPQKLTIFNATPEMKRFALEKLKNLKFLLIFTSISGIFSYNGELETEIHEISNPCREIGQVIEYHVDDIFGAKIYPDLRKIGAKIGGRMVDVKGRPTLTIPMSPSKELHVYRMSQSSKILRNSWILRFEVVQTMSENE